MTKETQLLVAMIFILSPFILLIIANWKDIWDYKKPKKKKEKVMNKKELQKEFEKLKEEFKEYREAQEAKEYIKEFKWEQITNKKLREEVKKYRADTAEIVSQGFYIPFIHHTTTFEAVKDYGVKLKDIEYISMKNQLELALERDEELYKYTEHPEEEKKKASVKQVAKPKKKKGE